MPKYLDISPEALATIPVKARKVEDLTLEDVKSLAIWCDWQTSSLWEGMNLQEILNVYRVSAEWDTWEAWAQEEREAAHAAWNRAVIEPSNKMAKAL